MVKEVTRMLNYSTLEYFFCVILALRRKTTLESNGDYVEMSINFVLIFGTPIKLKNRPSNNYFPKPKDCLTDVSLNHFTTPIKTKTEHCFRGNYNYISSSKVTISLSKIFKRHI